MKSRKDTAGQSGCSESFRDVDVTQIITRDRIQTSILLFNIKI